VSGQANPNALYLIGSGGNDASAAELIFGKDAAKANSLLFNQAGSLINSVSQLKAAGGRYIVVTDEYVPPSADATATAYGKTLVGAIWNGLAAAGVNFIPADTISVIAAVEQNPFAFGITAPINANACIKPAPYPVSTGYGFICAQTTIPNPNYGYLVSADATRTHLEAVDDHTFRIHFIRKDKLTLPDLAVNIPVVMNSKLAKAHATDKDPWAQEWLERNEAGSGAFKVESWNPGQELILTRFDGWTQGKLPALKRVIVREIPAAGTRRSLLEKGDADVSYGLPPKDFAELAVGGKVKVVGVPVENALST
jgi:hypothetical protein